MDRGLGFDGGGRRALGVYAVEGEVWLVRRRGQAWLDEEDLELTVVARPEVRVRVRVRLTLTLTLTLTRTRTRTRTRTLTLNPDPEPNPKPKPSPKPKPKPNQWLGLRRGWGGVHGVSLTGR